MATLSETKEFAISCPDVEHFVHSNGLESEYAEILSRFQTHFQKADWIKVTLADSPEDDGEGGERLLFEVRCEVDRKGFRQLCEAFYAGIRSLKIYPLIAILQDL